MRDRARCADTEGHTGRVNSRHLHGCAHTARYWEVVVVGIDEAEVGWPVYTDSDISAARIRAE